MGVCIVCENQYKNSFDVQRGGKSYTFDSFECAINKLAPICKICSCKIIGHGMESNSDYYCGAHCARKGGIKDARDYWDAKI